MRPIKLRGKDIKTGEWRHGTGYTDFLNIYGAKSSGRMWIWCNYGWVEVAPSTVGQLRHIKDGVEYYDGDIYYHAGYGDETVSDLCELQMSLIDGTSDDIGHVTGNIHDTKDKA